MIKKFELTSMDEKDLIDITVYFNVITGKYSEQLKLEYNIEDCLIEVNGKVVPELPKLDRVYCMDQIDNWTKKEIARNGYDLWYNKKEDETMYEGDEV